MKNKLIFFEEESEIQPKKQNPQTIINASSKKFLIHFSSDQQEQPTRQLAKTHQNFSESTHTQKQPQTFTSFRKCNSLRKKINRKPFFGQEDNNESIDQPKNSSFIQKQKLKKITAVGDLSEQYEEVIQLSKTVPVAKKNKIEKQAVQQKQTKQLDKHIDNHKEQQIIKISQKTKSKSLVFEFQDENDDVQQQKGRKTTYSQEMFNTFQSKEILKQNHKSSHSAESESQQSIQPQDYILNPSEAINKHSYQLAHYFGALNIFSDKKVFLLRAIPKNVVLQFEIHQYQGFFKNTLQLWLNLGHSMVRMLKAKPSSGMNMKSLGYDILLENQGRDIRISKLKSDFQRRNYQILDGQNNKQSKIYGHFFYAKSLLFKTTQLYIPIAQQNNQYKAYYKNSISNYLGDLYKIPPNDESICKLEQAKLEQAEIKKFNEKHEFQQSSRNCFLKDYAHKTLRLGIGKKGTNRFKVVAGQGISPLIVFALGIIIMQIK